MRESALGGTLSTLTSNPKPYGAPIASRAHTHPFQEELKVEDVEASHSSALSLSLFLSLSLSLPPSLPPSLSLSVSAFKGATSFCGRQLLVSELPTRLRP